MNKAPNEKESGVKNGELRKEICVVCAANAGKLCASCLNRETKELLDRLVELQKEMGK